MVIVYLSLFSCNSKSNKSSHKTEIKTFGDTLKIEYTYAGDTIYQKRIDLKGLKDDGFDSGFEVRSIWKTKQIKKINCDDKVWIKKKNLGYSFCLDDILVKIQTQFKHRVIKPNQKESILNFQKELVLLEDGELDTIRTIDFFTLYDFVNTLDCEIIDFKSNTKINKIRFENYKTPFSRGRIYYLINNKEDTLATYHLQDWKR